MRYSELRIRNLDIKIHVIIIIFLYKVRDIEFERKKLIFFYLQLNL